MTVGVRGKNSIPEALRDSGSFGRNDGPISKGEKVFNFAIAFSAPTAAILSAQHERDFSSVSDYLGMA